MKVKAIVCAIACLSVALPWTASAAPSPSTSPSRSYNWSGYVAKGAGYTSVSGSWTIASGRDTAHSLSANATWIGIGGFDGTNNLIQTGTRTMKWNGKITYQAWYELLPAPPIPFKVAIHPGDVVQATITETSPDMWNITLANQTTGKSSSVSVHYASNKTSVEWIVERPKLTNGGLVALTPFNSFTFSSLAATKNGKAVTPVTAAAKKVLLIEKNGTPLLTPSALTHDGRSFTIAAGSLGGIAGIPQSQSREL